MNTPRADMETRPCFLVSLHGHNFLLAVESFSYYNMATLGISSPQPPGFVLAAVCSCFVLCLLGDLAVKSVYFSVTRPGVSVLSASWPSHARTEISLKAQEQYVSQTLLSVCVCVCGVGGRGHRDRSARQLHSSASAFASCGQNHTQDPCCVN